jgi:hypothetical protein
MNYERLDRVALWIAQLAILFGLFLAAYGVTASVQERNSHPFPNVQHATTYPVPGDRR